MKIGKILGTALGLAMSVGVAQAADLGKGHYAKAEASHDCCTHANWRGLYLGVGVGIGATLNEITLASPFIGSVGLDSFAGDGVFGTVQIGYDAHLSNHIVAGLFADFEFGGNKARVSANIPGLFSGDLVSIEKNHSWSIGARLGFLTHNTLWYVPFGYTSTDVDLTIPGGLISASDFVKSNSHSGFFIGAGAETKIADRLGLKFEYRYTQFDDKCLFCEPGIVDIKNEPRDHSARLVLTYKLDLGHRHAAEPMK